MLFERLFKSRAARIIERGNRAEKEGRLAEACALYREAVAAAPESAKAHLNLGIALEAAGDIAGAARCYEKALEIDPADAYASYNLGRLSFARGELARAERLLGEALRRRPQLSEARIVLGCVLDAQGRLSAAVTEFEACLAQRPHDFGALFQYAGTLSRLGRAGEAAAALRRAIALEPASADARLALAHVLAAEEPAAAATELERLLETHPDLADAHYNYGAVLRTLLRPVEAERAVRRALELDARHARAYRLLAALLVGQRRAIEALELLREARARLPEDFDLESAELFALLASPDISEEQLFARHAAFGARLEAAHAPRLRHRGTRDPERRLRIGYVGDLYYHVVSLCAVPVIERHDRSAFEAYCYSTAGRQDAVSRHLAGTADAWREAAALTPSELADAVHADGIDLLVDLAGHSGEQRLAVFAQRPAPVQLTWLGYLNSTGLTRMDYRISDPHADPPGLTEALHTERLLRLAHSQWCYRPALRLPPAPQPPCLGEGRVTFGSFNQAYKLSRPTLALWADILARVAHSRLLVVGVPAGQAQEELARELAGLGVARERLTLVPRVALEDYFRCYHAVDIALDTMPYSGGTTTIDALWMGVPVITAPGRRPTSRSAASILATVGLTNWIAPSAEEYVRRAAAFAADRAMLAELRRSLRMRLQASPLMDEDAFTRDLEKLYRQAWRNYCIQG